MSQTITTGVIAILLSYYIHLYDRRLQKHALELQKKERDKQLEGNNSESNYDWHGHEPFVHACGNNHNISELASLHMVSKSILYNRKWEEKATLKINYIWTEQISKMITDLSQNNFRLELLNHDSTFLLLPGRGVGSQTQPNMFYFRYETKTTSFPSSLSMFVCVKVLPFLPNLSLAHKSG